MLNVSNLTDVRYETSTIRSLCTHHGIDNQLAAKLVSIGTLRNIKKGHYLHYQDECKEVITLVIEGTLGFHPSSSDYTGPFINLISPGIILNEDNFVLGTDIYKDVKAATNCRVLSITYEAASELYKWSMPFHTMLNRSMAIKQRFFHILFDLRTEPDPKDKVHKVMLAIIDMTKQPLIKMNIGSLASLLRMSRNSVGKVCAELIEENVIVKTASGFHFVMQDNSPNMLRLCPKSGSKSS